MVLAAALGPQRRDTRWGMEEIGVLQRNQKELLALLLVTTPLQTAQRDSAVPLSLVGQERVSEAEVKIVALGSSTSREDAEGARAEEESGDRDGPQTEKHADCEMP